MAAVGAVVLAALWSGIPAPDAGADSPTAVFVPEWDDEATLRNPGMGWMVYAEEFGKPLADVGEFWGVVDPYVEDASVL